MRKILLGSIFIFGLTLLVLSVLHRCRGWFSFFSDQAYWATGLTFGFVGLKFLGHNLIPLAARATYIQWFSGHRALAVGCSGVIVTFAFGTAAKCFHWGIEAYGWQRVWGAWWILSWAIALPIIFLGIHEGCRSTHSKTSAETPVNNGIPMAPFCRTVIASWEFWMLSIGVTMQLLIANGISLHIVDIHRELRPRVQHVFDIFIPIGIIGACSGPILGGLLDKISMKYGLLALYALQATILGSFLMTSEKESLWAFIPSMGLSWSLYGILLTASWSRFVTHSYQGRTLGWVYAQTMLGSAIGPWIFSFSHLKWGSYLPTIKWLMMGIGAMMALTISFVKKETLVPKA
jgi:hypothetical protein